MHDIRRYITLVESLLHGFRAPYIKDGRTCEIFKNPTRREYKQALGKNDTVRAFIVGNDLLIWDVFVALHQTVREELKLPADAIPINLYGAPGGEAAAVVTDNTRNTPWWHNSDLWNVIDENPFMNKNFTSLEIDYYDSDIVGDWAGLDDDELDEAATPYGRTYWYNPGTKQIIPASDHGEAVIDNPDAFGIDDDVQRQMDDAFPDVGGEEEELEIPDEPHPAELWGARTGWYRNDAWETLAMNRGWVRIGEATSITSAYVSSSTAAAVWGAVNHLFKNGGLADKVEIEIARPEHQIFTIIAGDDLNAFIRGGPKRAEAFLSAHS